MPDDQWVDINNEQWVDTNDAQWLDTVTSGVEVNLGASIHGYAISDLDALIGAHQPKNLLSYVTGLAYKDLPGYLNPIEPIDLGASIQPRLPKNLKAEIYGWDTLDLQALINIIAKDNLPATIGAHRPKNVRASIKGWVREAYSDLGANIGAFDTNELPAEIRGTELRQLPAYLFAIAPVDLSANIHGWDTKDLQGIINVIQYPYNLPASINGRPWKYRNLSATITSNLLGPHKDLTAYILPSKGTADLSAYLGVNYSKDLSAYVDTGNDIGNLSAQINPKMMRLTGVLSIITMEHKDLSATISIPCFYSDYRELSSYIRPVFQADLPASIHPQGWLGGIDNLGAKWGYQDTSVMQDKLPIILNFSGWDFRTEDRLLITASIFRSALNLGATITAVRTPANLSAYINGVFLEPYEFDYWKLRERVQNRTYSQVAIDYEDVDISFQTIVRDYFYSSGSDVVAKVNKYERFVTKVASYYSQATARRLDERLHKIKYLYDMRHFNSIDEAVKFAILYVTETPERNLQAMITATGSFNNLTSSIIGSDKISTTINLSGSIDAQREHTYDVVLAFTDDGVGYLEF